MTRPALWIVACSLAVASCSERSAQYNDLMGRWKSENVTIEFQDVFIWGKSVSYENNNQYLPRLFKTPITSVSGGSDSRVLFVEIEMFKTAIKCQIQFSRDRLRINVSECLREMNGSWSRVRD